MSYNISDNDDDLFNYDPAQDSVTQTLNPESTKVTAEPSADDTSRHHREFVNSIKSNIEDADADLGLHDPKMNPLVSNLYGSFQEAINNFIGTIQKDHFAKSIHMTLDELTNGKFSMLNLYHHYEMRIARRSALVNLFGAVFREGQELNEDGEEVAPFLRKISELLNINFTHNYYVSTFNVSIDILNHSLTMDKVIYQFLADRLGLPLNELATADMRDMDSAQLEQAVHALTIHGFRDSINNQMFEAFFAAEPNEHSSTLSQRLTEIFNTEPTYMNSMKYME